MQERNNMVSKLRVQCRLAIEQWAMMMGLKGKEVLDIGIAGDPKPGENHKWFGYENSYKTMDIDSRYDPDFVGDICDCELDDGSFDLVILSNVIEHIWDYKAAIAGVHRVTKDWAIIDSPLQIQYHADDDFEDYWRFTTVALKRLAEDVGFEVVGERQTLLLSSILCRKK